MKYRVNFGQGQVSHTMKSEAEARRYIEESLRDSRDPYAAHYFVEFWDPAGGWFPVAKSKSRRRRD